jgi:malonyl-ACP O-methyltransferase BioC
MTEVDKHIVEQRFARSIQTYRQHAVVQNQMAQQLVELTRPYLTAGGSVFEVGCGCGTLTQYLLKQFRPASFIANDLVAGVLPELSEITNKHNNLSFKFLQGDAEVIDFPQNCDAVFAGAALQWFHQPENFFVKVAESLNEKGILAFSTFGHNNYLEVDKITHKTLSYKTLTQLTTLLKSHFSIIHQTEYQQTLWFEHPVEILRHIKATGVGGLQRQNWGKRQLDYFVAGYQHFFEPGKGYPLTYHPILIVAQRHS